MNYVNATYDDWERFITKEDITEVFNEYIKKNLKT
jgi:hypothetical protein